MKLLNLYWTYLLIFEKPFKMNIYVTKKRYSSVTVIEYKIAALRIDMC